MCSQGSLSGVATPALGLVAVAPAQTPSNTFPSSFPVFKTKAAVSLCPILLYTLGMKSRFYFVDALAVVWLLAAGFFWVFGMIFSDSPDFTILKHSMNILLYASPAILWLGYSIYKNYQSGAKTNWRFLVAIAVVIGVLGYFLTR